MQATTASPPLSALGLSLTFRRGLRSLAFAVAVGFAFGLWMVLADATFLRGAVPEVQREMVARFTMLERITFAWRAAFFDEAVLRGAVLTGLVALARAVGLGGWRAFWPAILATALLAWPLTVLPYLSDLDWTALTAVREVILHGAAGALWGWLYCRHGWLAALAGHWSAHLALQPLLGITT